MHVADTTRPTLELSDIAVTRGGRTIVHDISIAFPSGRLSMLLGPNGAGKSTVIKAASGEWRTARGEVRLNGTEIKSMTPAELARRRAVVPQAAMLSSPFTALDVVMLGVTVPGFGLATDCAPGRAALAAVGLEGFEGRLYTELSGGERQRVHIARAFSQLDAAPGVAAGDSVLLLDEPTASLDPGHQVLVLQALRAHAELGRTVVAVMHDLNLASAWADHVVMMRDGRVHAIGAPQELFNDAVLSDVYGCRMRSNLMPHDGRAFVLPHHTTLHSPYSSGATLSVALGASGRG